MKHVELIIFDLDGTLVDSREDIADAVNHTLKELKLMERSRAEISSYIGKGVSELMKQSLGENTDILGQALSIFEEYYRKHSTDKSVLYPGVQYILERFKTKRKTIVTNRNYEFAVDTLTALGICGYFEDVIGGDDTTCLKPSSCPLDKTVDIFKIDRKKTIMIGDMHIDIIAGKKAGVTTCAVTYGIGKREDILKANPDYIIDDILELEKIIN